jgi:hypothetical protein
LVLAAELGAIALAGIALSSGLVVVIGLALAIASYIALGTILDFGDMSNTFLDNREEYVCILYNATNADDAKAAIIALSTTLGMSSLETTLLGYVVNFQDLNSVLAGNPEWDLEAYTGAVDCANCYPPSIFEDWVWGVDGSWVGTILYDGDPIENNQPLLGNTQYEYEAAFDAGFYKIVFEFGAPGSMPEFWMEFEHDVEVATESVEYSMLVGNPSATLNFEVGAHSYHVLASPDDRGDVRRVTVRSDNPFGGLLTFLDAEPV